MSKDIDSAFNNFLADVSLLKTSELAEMKSIRDTLENLAESDPVLLIRLALFGHDDFTKKVFETLVAEYNSLKEAGKNINSLEKAISSLEESVEALEE